MPPEPPANVTPKHAEMLVRAAGLDDKSNTAVTPGVKVGEPDYDAIREEAALLDVRAGDLDGDLHAMHATSWAKVVARLLGILLVVRCPRNLVLPG